MATERTLSIIKPDATRRNLTGKINARFEPEKREDGLLAIGAARLSLTSSGFEQYFALASSISDQVLEEKRRAAGRIVLKDRFWFVRGKQHVCPHSSL